MGYQFDGMLDSLSEDGLDGDDRCKVVLWSDCYREPLVLKRYEGEGQWPRGIGCPLRPRRS